MRLCFTRSLPLPHQKSHIHYVSFTSSRQFKSKKGCFPVMMDQKTSFYSVANETSPLIYPSFYPPLHILSTPIILSNIPFAPSPGQPIHNLTNTFRIFCRVTQNTSDQYLHLNCAQPKYYHTQHNSSSKHYVKYSTINTFRLLEATRYSTEISDFTHFVE